ncbi:AraC-like ligand-binding domain-containing protein [Streptomyces tsukubensis]|uniref:AraC-like ligand-binding domain-containing protein n=1 Tax=Streptomyces tsukubensis TaxID=83656 RepID=UPI00369B5013
MPRIVFDTQDLPPCDRFDSWCELVTKSVLPIGVRAANPASFNGSLQINDLGLVQVSRIIFPAMETIRGEGMIRRSDPEVYQIYLQLEGTTRFTQDDREAVLGPGNMILFSSSRPFRGSTDPEYLSGSSMILQLPHLQLAFPRKLIDQVAARRVTAKTGVAAVTARYLTELADQVPHYTHRDMANISGVTLDLVNSWLSHELEDAAGITPESRNRAMKVRIHDYIRGHLRDPGLSPATIAAAHGISTRHLYNLFNGQGLPVAAWIRERRLERCRRDLADPGLYSRSIQTIAASWGFINNAHFSRAFRGAYGMPPKEYRHLMQHANSAQVPSTTLQEQPSLS